MRSWETELDMHIPQREHTSASMMCLRFLWTAAGSMLMRRASGDPPKAFNFNFSIPKLLSPAGARSFRAWRRSISASFLAAASLSWATCTMESNIAKWSHWIPWIMFTFKWTLSQSCYLYKLYLISQILDLSTFLVTTSSTELHWRHSFCKFQSANSLSKRLHIWAYMYKHKSLRLSTCTEKSPLPLVINLTYE